VAPSHDARELYATGQLQHIQATCMERMKLAGSQNVCRKTCCGASDGPLAARLQVQPNARTSLIAGWSLPSSKSTVAWRKESRPCMGRYSLFSSFSIISFSACESVRRVRQSRACARKLWRAIQLQSTAVRAIWLMQDKLCCRAASAASCHWLAWSSARCNDALSAHQIAGCRQDVYQYA
jgi:hypothetical protein